MTNSLIDYYIWTTTKTKHLSQVTFNIPTRHANIFNFSIITWIEIRQDNLFFRLSDAIID